MLGRRRSARVCRRAAPGRTIRFRVPARPMARDHPSARGKGGAPFPLRRTERVLCASRVLRRAVAGMPPAMQSGPTARAWPVGNSAPGIGEIRYGIRRPRRMGLVTARYRSGPDQGQRRPRCIALASDPEAKIFPLWSGIAPAAADNGRPPSVRYSSGIGRPARRVLVFSQPFRELSCSRS